jgi:exosortase/archaeosortase family protein
MADLPASNTIPAPLERHRSILVVLAIFLLTFAILQGLYGLAAGGAVERFFVETIGSRPAVALIHLLTPEINATAKGARILAPGGGINIRSGCEGSEILFLLLAVFLSVAMPWRSRLTGIALGVGLVIVLNQCRILALFYAYRADRAFFDLLHTIVAPVVLIAATGLFFHAWLQFSRRPG